MKNFFLIFSFIISSCIFGNTQEIDLTKFEKKICSQNGEDGILVAIFKIINPIKEYYVEFGVENGTECNTSYLRESYKWDGLMMDGFNSNQIINLQREIITAENINELFEKYNVPEEFGLLSIDIDYNDFHVWKSLNQKYRPAVVVIEFNPTHLPNEDKVAIYNPNYFWDGSNYYGASILAQYKLGRKKGYSLVYVDNNAVNLFFIRDDILNSSGYTFKNQNCVEKLYKTAHYSNGPNGGHPADLLNRSYITADELLADLN